MTAEKTRVVVMNDQRGFLEGDLRSRLDIGSFVELLNLVGFDAESCDESDPEIIDRIVAESNVVISEVIRGDGSVWEPGRLAIEAAVRSAVGRVIWSSSSRERLQDIDGVKHLLDHSEYCGRRRGAQETVGAISVAISRVSTS